MGRAFSAQSVLINGTADVWIEYQDGGQNQVRTLNWALIGGVTMHAVVKDGGSVVLDETVVGPDEGNMNTPGTYRMREVTDERGTYLDLPAGITYSIEVQG